MNGPTLRLNTVRQWAPFGIGAAAVLGIYAPVVPAMVAEWAAFPSLSHGFAIPLIAAYLVWGRRAQIAKEAVTSSGVGLPVVMLGLTLLAVGSMSGESFLARLSLPVMLLGTVLYLAGPGVARHVWMGIAYLLFMVPLPYVTLKMFTYQSQLFDAGVTAEALGLLGVPVLREGILLHLPNMTLEVAPDCSSVPAIAALGALGAAYAQMKPRPAWIRAVLILAAAPLGLASNIVRIIVTALSAYYFGRVALDNAIHQANGTTVFLATVGLLIALDAVLLRLGARKER